MKTIKQITGQMYDFPTLDEEDAVNFVYWPGQCIKAIQPQAFKYIKCQVCQGTNLAKLLDPNFQGYGAFCMDCTVKGKYPRKKQERREVLLPGLPHEFSHATLELIDNKPKEIINAIKAYAQDPGGFLLLAGKPGLGKTFCAATIMKHVAQKGGITRYIEAMAMYQQWLQRSNNYLPMLESLQETHFLVIDDFGHKSSSESYTEFLHMLFSKRKSNKSPTVIITNLTSEQISNQTTAAIFSRIISGIILKFEGKDRRKTF